jgi:hypothetical protein
MRVHNKNNHTNKEFFLFVPYKTSQSKSLRVFQNPNVEVLNFTSPLFLVFLSFVFLLLCWVEVRCGIYKSSYNASNVSYVNSPSPPFFFIPPAPPHFWSSFNIYHFYRYIHLYIIFTPYSPFYTLSLTPPLSHWYQTLCCSLPLHRICSALLFSHFVEEKQNKTDIFACLR